MHVQYQLNSDIRKTISEDDLVGVTCFLNQTEKYSAAICDLRIGIIDVVYNGEQTGIQPEHMAVIEQFCYQMRHLSTEQFEEIMKSRHSIVTP